MSWFGRTQQKSERPLLVAKTSGPVQAAVDEDMLLLLLKDGRFDDAIDKIKARKIDVAMLNAAERAMTNDGLSQCMSIAAAGSQTTILHTICDVGEWPLARWCFVTLNKSAFRCRDPKTGQTPPMTLALRIDNVAGESKDYRSWIAAVFADLDYKTLQMQDNQGWTVLHFLAVNNKMLAYENLFTKHPLLLDIKTNHAMVPSQLLVAQQDHVIRDLRDEKNELAKKNNELVNELSKLDLGYEALQRAVQDREMSIEALRNQAENISTDLLRMREVEVSLLADKERTHTAMADVVEDREEAEQAIVTAREEMRAIAEKLKESEKTRALLESKLSINSQVTGQKNVLIDELAAQRDELEEEMKLLRSKAEQALNDSQRIEVESEQEIMAAQQRLQQIALERASMEEQMEELREEQASSERQRELIKQQIEDNRKENEELAANHASAQKQNELLQQRLDEAHQKESVLVLELEKERGRVTNLVKEKNDLETRSEKIRCSLSNDVEALKTQLADLRALHESSRVNEARLRAEEEQRIALLEKSEQRARELSEEAMRADGLNAALARAQADIDAKQAALETAEQSLAEMQASSERFTLALEEHSEHAEQWKTRAEWFETDSAAARERARAAEERLVEARQQLAQLEQDRSDWRRRELEQKGELEALRKKAAAGQPVVEAGAAAAGTGKTAGGGDDDDTSGSSNDGLRPTTPRSGRVSRTATLRRVRGDEFVDGTEQRKGAQKLMSSSEVMRSNAERDKSLFKRVENCVKSGNLAGLQEYERMGVSLHRLTDVGLTYLEVALDEAATSKEGLETVLAKIDEEKRTYEKLAAEEEQDERQKKETLRCMRDYEERKEHLFCQANATIGKLAPLIKYLMEQGCECEDMERFKSRRNLPNAVLDLINNRDEHSPFCKALLAHDVGLATQHASDVKDVNRVPMSHMSEKFSYIHLAVLAARCDKSYAPSTSFVQMLQRKDLNPNVVDANGRTPLHLALSKPMKPHHRVQVVEWLMAAGADPTKLCSYEPMLEETRKLLEKKERAAAGDVRKLSKKSKKSSSSGGSKSLLNVFQKSSKTEEEVKQEKQLRALKYGTPINMAKALDDPELLARLTNRRYLRVTLAELTETVLVCVRFHSRVSLLAAREQIKKQTLLHELIGRYGTVFYGFNRDFVQKHGSHKTRRILCKDAGVADTDSEREVQAKIARMVEADHAYTKMLEDYGSRLGQELTAATHLGADVKNELVEECEKQLTLFYELCESFKGPVFNGHNPLKKAMQTPDNSRFAMLHAFIKEQVDKEFPNRAAVMMNRKASHKYKVIEALIKFQEAVEKQWFEVALEIQKPAEELYPKAVLNAICTFIQGNEVGALDFILTRRDSLFGGVSLDTIVDEENLYTPIECAAAHGAIESLCFCMSLQPDRLDMAGESNMTVVHIAAFAKQPAAVVAIDHFKHQRKLSYTAHPNLAHYKVETSTGRNALHQLALAHRADLVEFCIGALIEKLKRKDSTENAFTPLELARSLNTFDTDKQRRDHERIIELFSAALEGREAAQYDDLGSVPKALVPPPPVSSAPATPRYDNNIKPPPPKENPPPPAVDDGGDAVVENNYEYNEETGLYGGESDDSDDGLDEGPPPLLLPPTLGTASSTDLLLADTDNGIDPDSLLSSHRSSSSSGRRRKHRSDEASESGAESSRRRKHRSKEDASEASSSRRRRKTKSSGEPDADASESETASSRHRRKKKTTIDDSMMGGSESRRKSKK